MKNAVVKQFLAVSNALGTRIVLQFKDENNTPVTLRMLLPQADKFHTLLGKAIKDASVNSIHTCYDGHDCENRMPDFFGGI